MSELFHVRSRCPLNGQPAQAGADRCSNCGLEPLHTLVLEPALWMGHWEDTEGGPLEGARLEIHPAGLTVAAGVPGRPDEERHWPWSAIRRFDAGGDARWSGRLEVELASGKGCYRHHPLAIDLLHEWLGYLLDYGMSIHGFAFRHAPSRLRTALPARRRTTLAPVHLPTGDALPLDAATPDAWSCPPTLRSLLARLCQGGRVLTVEERPSPPLVLSLMGFSSRPTEPVRGEAWVLDRDLKPIVHEELPGGVLSCFARLLRLNARLPLQGTLPLHTTMLLRHENRLRTALVRLWADGTRRGFSVALLEDQGLPATAAPDAAATTDAAAAQLQLEGLTLLEDPGTTTEGYQKLFALGHRAAGALPVLLTRLGHVEERPMLSAVMSAIGEPAVAGLIESLGGSTEVRVSAVECLRALAREGVAAAVPPLGALLTDCEPEVRRVAAHGLWSAGAHAAGAMPAVLNALSSNDPLVRAAAVEMVAHTGGSAGAQEAADGIVSNFDEGDRIGALGAVAGLGTSAGRSAELIDRALTNRDLAGAAAWAAARVGGDRALARIARAADHGGEARVSAVRALGLMRQDAARAVPKLLEALADERLRWPALEALAMMGPAAHDAAGAVDALVRGGCEPVATAARAAAERLTAPVPPPSPAS